MALPVDVCIGQRNVCILRAAKLDDDCSPLGGADSGVVTVGIVTMTASAEIEEGTIAEPKTGCGDIAFTVADPDILKRYNVTGEILFHDVEMMHDPVRRHPDRRGRRRRLRRALVGMGVARS